MTYGDEDDVLVEYENPPPLPPDPEDPWSLAIKEARISGEFIMSNVTLNRKNAIDVRALSELPLLYSLRLIKLGLTVRVLVPAFVDMPFAAVLMPCCCRWFLVFMFTKTKLFGVPRTSTRTFAVG